MTTTDPTGLGDVRDLVRAETDKRWRGLRRHVRRTIVGGDALGLGPEAPVTIMPAAEKAEQLRSWVDEQIATRVGHGGWLEPHLATAAGRAAERVSRLVGIASSLPASLPVCRAATAIHVSRIREDAAAAAGTAMVETSGGAGKVARAIDATLARGHRRSLVLGEHALTQAYTQATLDAFQAAGRRRVGSVSEHRVMLADDLEAAGILFVDPDGCGLFVHRTDGEGWALPGGGVEGPETPKIAAVREGHEELGGVPIGELEHLTTRTRGGVTFHTFRHDVPARFDPVLNHEHDAHVWAPLASPPLPLHPGVSWTLRRRGLMDAGWEDEPRDEKGKWSSSSSSSMSTEEWYSKLGFKAPQLGLTKPATHDEPKKKSALYPESVRPILLESATRAAEVNHGNESWHDHPTTLAGWAGVAGQVPLEEPPLEVDPFTTKTGEVVPDKHQRLATGAVIREGDGSVWLVHPKNQFGGYRATFPKGGLEEGLSPQANAIKEAYEETGLQIKIVGLLGDFRKTTSKTRYYEAVRVGGNIKRHGWETQSLSLARPEHLRTLADHPSDQKVIDEILKVEDANPFRSGHSGRYVTKLHHIGKLIGGEKRERWGAAEREDDFWNVETAADDRVCPTCDDIADSGPYEIDEARDLIPAHPGCRCVFVAYS